MEFQASVRVQEVRFGIKKAMPTALKLYAQVLANLPNSERGIFILGSLLGEFQFTRRVCEVLIYGLNFFIYSSLDCCQKQQPHHKGQPVGLTILEAPITARNFGVVESEDLNSCVSFVTLSNFRGVTQELGVILNLSQLIFEIET